DAVDFLPYLCQLDYIECELMGIDLDRQHTLAGGDPVCDFRLKRHRASAP
ncbi:MAG: L-2-amino-thiazoline-4-carboxylic acid hydrolase, partial [Anaerolineae bacterium]|nr:L-2-amino-thiazoline-4-carboxylic acid hydrolase [Anaerolineae bacterium]